LKNKDKYVPDLVIHSMAVSDYTVGLVTSLKYIDDNYVEDIVYEVKGSRTIPDKMSSELEYPVIILKRTPKVIDDIKSLWPETYLVGFKLLNNSTPLQLLTAQVNLMERAKCDMVVGNDLSTISAEGHLFKVLTDKGEILPFNTKASLAYFLTKVI
jgi:phosphopantothenate-cysteine ligase